METLLLLLKVFAVSAVGSMGVFGGIIAAQKLWGPIRISHVGKAGVENHFHGITSTKVTEEIKNAG